MFNQSHIKNLSLLLVFAYFVLMWGNGIVSLTHPDEVFYIQSAKEMLAHQSWLTPYIFDEPQFEKPILSYWLFALAIKYMGLNSFAARFWPAAFGILGVLVTYWIAWMMFHRKRTAFFSALVLGSSFIYLALSRAVLTDMIFSVWVVISLGFFWRGYKFPEKRNLSIVWGFVFSGLAVLTKGILGIIFPLAPLMVFLFSQKKMDYWKTWATFWGMALWAAIAVPWHVLMIHWYGQEFISEYWGNVHVRRIYDAEHEKSNTWYFYPALMWAGMLPWCFLLFPAIHRGWQNWKDQKDSQSWGFLVCWIMLVFLIMQVAHSKLASYIFPAFPAIAIFIGYYLDDVLEKSKNSIPKVFQVVTMLMGVILVGAAVAAPIALNVYQSMIPEPLGVIVFGIAALALGAIIFWTSLTKRWGAAIIAHAGVTLCVLIMLFLGKANAEPWVSCRDITDIFKKIDQSDSTIICSKFYVRGVRFYTDRKTAVMDLNGSGFFSPHPIPYLNSEPKLLNFLLSQPVTYAIVKITAINDLKRIAADRFKVEDLEHLGGKYILRITRLDR